MHRALNDPRRHGTNQADRGFTLVEMIVVIAVMGLVATALATVVAVVLRNASANPDRLDEARGLQQVAAYLPNDVASAIPNEMSDDPARPSPCPGYAGGLNVLDLRWREQFHNGPTREFRVGYRTEHLGDRIQLVRISCQGMPWTQAVRTPITSLTIPWDAAVDVTINGGHVVMRLTLPDGRVLSIAATSSSPTLGLDDWDAGEDDD